MQSFTQLSLYYSERNFCKVNPVDQSFRFKPRAHSIRVRTHVNINIICCREYPLIR